MNCCTGKPVVQKLFLNFLLSALLIFASANAYCQKYNFTHYDIEDGLTQSQVGQITQDKSHHLLIATLGGIGRFDGKNFTSITKDDGLPDNTVSAITTDKKGRIWVSSPASLYYYYAGQVHKNSAGGSASFAGARALLTDGQDNIWGIKIHTLFRIANGQASAVNITGGIDTVTRIAKDVGGTLFAAIHNKGIFCFKNNEWTEVLHLGFLPDNGFVKQIIVDDLDPDHLYVLTNQRLLSAKNNVIQPVNINLPEIAAGAINFIAQDNLHGLWLGAAQGSYYLNLDNNGLRYYNENNGFTNNPVVHIFRDIDNNMWFGTNGAGLYRFNGNSFISFEQTQRFADPNIMQFGTDVNGDILIASSGSGLFTFDGKRISKIEIPSDNPLTKKVYTICLDKDKNTWIGTLSGGLWKKTGKKITRIYPRNINDTALSFNDIKKDNQNTLWFATASGCYYLDQNLSLVKVLNANCRSLLVLGHDSVLVVTNNGLTLLKSKKVDSSYKADFLKNSYSMCINYYRGRIYVGTMDYGIFIWDPVKGNVIKLNKDAGLSTNSVYSMGIDPYHILWVGTGRGVNKFKINNDGSFQKIIDDNISSLISECNHNSLAFFNDQVWIGTTRGLLVLKDEGSAGPVTTPYTIIQDVQFFNHQAVTYTYENGYKIPRELKLPSYNSHITLSFKGVNLKNPAGVLYSYRLEPMDNKFSPPSKNDVVDYPSLPPGEYVFYVKSATAGGTQSNTASFAFEITPAYYQTAWFKAVIIILFILSGFGAWRYAKVKDEQKRKLIEYLRLEEQVKIRKQTAEDFHDDLGNKLTRINVLSEILDKKINPEHAEERKLITQIRENAAALFTGSKHILWALEPDNDHLSQVLNHVIEFGNDIFLNTSVNFIPEITVNAFNGVTLSMGHGRNITMIFKELFNNALKHADAKNVILTASLNQDRNICIMIEDDGKGFDNDHVKSGNGMRNMANRAKKVNGAIEFNSTKGNGTRVILVLQGYDHLF